MRGREEENMQSRAQMSTAPVIPQHYHQMKHNINLEWFIPEIRISDNGRSCLKPALRDETNKQVRVEFIPPEQTFSADTTAPR